MDMGIGLGIGSACRASLAAVFSVHSSNWPWAFAWGLFYSKPYSALRANHASRG